MNSEREAINRTLQKLAATFAGFDEKLSDAVLYLLGDPPEGLAPFESPDVVQRICFPHRWPERELELTHIHEALHHLVRERGGTREAAGSIRSEIKKGDIRAVLVRDVDGSRIPIPPERWSGQNSKQLWWYGKIDPGPIDPSGGSVYIALDALTGGGPLADPDPASYVPPFMQLMFEAIRHFGMPEAQPKKAELQAWFEAQSVEGVAISKSAAEYLATFIRPPEAMRGGQRRM